MNLHAPAVLVAVLAPLVPTLAWAGGSVVLFDRVPGALDPQECGGAGCWTNHLRVTDIDGDGDLDLLLPNYPDFFDGDAVDEPLAVYTNDGLGNFQNVSATAVGGYRGELRQIAVGDVDGDGFVDLYGPSGSGGPHVLFMNDGSGGFVDEADVRLPGDDFPSSGAARMGDVDSDGDLDIFSADGYAIGGPPFGRLYLNDGLGGFTEAVAAIPDSISGRDIDDVEFFDADRDFDLDLIVNAHELGTGALWLNDGRGTFSAGGSIDPPGQERYHYNIAPCDVDGDGDLDLWIDNIGGGFTEQLLINDGSANFSDQTAARVAGNPGVDDNGVICADIDGDGDFDGVVVSLSTPERWLVNDGTGAFTFVAGAFPEPDDCSLWGEFGDLDGDGRIDLVTGQGECDSSDEVYLANRSVAPDDRPPVIIAVETIGSVPAGREGAVRFAVSDRTVTDEGPRLSRAFAVLGSDGAEVEIEARFMGGDLFRAILPALAEGTVTVQVCAEDRQSNRACSEAQIYEIVEDSGGSSSGAGESSGGGGTAAADGTSSAGPTSASVGSGPDGSGPDGSGPVGSGPDGSGPSGTDAVTADGGGGDGGSGDDDGAGGGCGCRHVPPSSGWAWAWYGLVLGGLRRRREPR